MKQIVLMLLLINLSGCAVQREAGPVDLFSAEKEGAIVFGRLIVEWRSGEILAPLDRLDPMTLDVWNESTGERFRIVCESGDKDARFFASLPPGPYRILKVSKGRSDFNLRGFFELSGKEAAYLGTLKWIGNVSSGSISRRGGGMSGDVVAGSFRGRTVIEDHYEEESLRFKEGNPQMPALTVNRTIKIP